MQGETYGTNQPAAGPGSFKSCPNCGVSNANNSRFCSQCGTSLDGSGAAKDNAAAPPAYNPGAVGNNNNYNYNQNNIRQPLIYNNNNPVYAAGDGPRAAQPVAAPGKHIVQMMRLVNAFSIFCYS